MDYLFVLFLFYWVAIVVGFIALTLYEYHHYKKTEAWVRENLWLWSARVKQ